MASLTNSTKHLRQKNKQTKKNKKNPPQILYKVFQNIEDAGTLSNGMQPTLL